MEQNINVINFTVIIPHKNIPLLLQRCLDSIPRRDDLQIIVVDDASDETVVDFNRFPGLGDQRVEVIFSKAAKGGGHARNLGLTKALGKWVIFADADDFFTAEFPQIIYSYKDDESDLIYFNVDSVQSDDITKKADRSATKQTLFDNYRKDTKEGDISFRLKYPEPWGKMIKGGLIKSNQIKFDEVPVSNDYFFSIQIGCLAKQIKVVNKALYVITLRSGSISHNFGDTLDKLLIRLDVAIRVQSYLAKFGYELTPMPIRGLMVLLLKMNLSIFTKQLFKIHKAGLSVRKLLTQMFDPKFFKK